MNDITQGMKFTIDVKSGLVEMPQRAVLMKGDKNANRVSMALVDGEKAVSLEGATVTGTYVLAGIKMPLLGDVNENEATIILPDECYLSSGRYELRMHVALGSVKRTFLFITGYVESDGEGGTLDVEGVIPNIDDIIAQYAQMKEVTERTQEAADKANDAASRAPYVGANGNWFVWNAASGSYIDSGSKAQGPVGPQGPAGAEIDATLKVPGKAADAKATGDALSLLSEQIESEYALKNETAPSGFGLGAAGQLVSDCNAALQSGFYRFDEAQNSPFWYGTLVVTSRSDGICNQLAICNAGSDVGSIAVRAVGSTNVWEYVNPPANVGTEYRTVERFMGQPVYTKIIDCGLITNAKRITTDISNVVRYCGRFGSLPIPFKTPDGSYLVDAEVNAGFITMITSGFDGAAQGYMQLWYTK